MIRTLIALPYELARLPLAIVDRNVADRLPETSASRVTLDRAIGSVDRVAGAVLRNEDIARRGADRHRPLRQADRGGPAGGGGRARRASRQRRRPPPGGARRRASGRLPRTGPRPG